MSGIAAGAGEPEPLGYEFTYGFTVDATSSISGMAALTFTPISTGQAVSIVGEPGLVSSSLSDFENTLPIPLFENIVATGQAVEGTGVGPLIEQGSIIIQYNYTPNPPPVPSPEPGTLSLLGSGLIGLLGLGGLKISRTARQN